jgi:hypothetical protein
MLLVHAQGAAPDDIPTNLLALPDQCLLAVMQCCAHDTPSTISAATAHSRLHQAAVEALGSMTVISAKCRDQARVDSMLLYLSKHGQHVRSLALHGQQRWDVQRLELPLSLTKLEGLLLEGMRLHLQPGSGGTQGVLRAGLHLTRLELSDCMLLDGVEALAAALMQLPDLEHLRAGSLSTKGMQVFFPFDVLPHLQQLTCLILVHSQGRASNRIARKGDITSQSLQALTRLADLEFASPGSSYRERVTADMLSSADQLTRLVLSNADFAPSGLAGRTQLQHLTLRDCSFPTKYRPVADAPQLLFELQHFTQLTHLDLGGSCGSIDDLVGPSPQPAAYASLIASSELQHLDFSSNTLPAAAWQYMWPPGMTLPQLRHLDIRAIKELGDSLALPDTSVLVSCCPGLQTLRSTMPCSTAQLAPLQQLTGLHTLAVGAGGSVDSEGLQALCKLTGLQELHLPTTYPSAEARACILQLTQLTRLTHLHCTGYRTLCCNPQVRQDILVRHFLWWAGSLLHAAFIWAGRQIFFPQSLVSRGSYAGLCCLKPMLIACLWLCCCAGPCF